MNSNIITLIAFTFAASSFADDSCEHRAIHGAQVSVRPMPISPCYVFAEKRDWVKQPFRLAVVLIEFSDRKHAGIHSAAFCDRLLWPFGKARDFVVAPESDNLPAAIHNIRLEGDLIHFDLGPK